MVRPLEDTTNHLAPRRTKFAPARKPAPLQDLDAIATKPYVPERKKHAERPTTKMNRSLQLLFVAWLVAPYAISSLVDPVGCAAAWRWNLNTLKHLHAYQSSPLFLAACAMLAVERVVYTVVWCYPKAWLRFTRGVLRDTYFYGAGDNVVDVIYKFFKINKCFQGGGFALLYFLAAPAIRPGEISLFQWVVGANLVALGQALNVGIYRSIGKVGVYYGYKYGMSVPWCTGFPFNVCCAHPQYLGSALTAYGFVLLAATDAHVLRGWGGLAHVQALQYAYMSFVEHNI